MSIEDSIRDMNRVDEQKRQERQAARFAPLVERVAKMIRGGLPVDDPMLNTGLAEKHVDGSITFPVELGTDNDLCVTVTVSPGWQR